MYLITETAEFCRNTKTRRTNRSALLFCQLKFNLLGIGSRYRANTCASTALNALVFVDHVFAVAGRNAGYGAFAFASTAADAIIVNNICHR